MAGKNAKRRAKAAKAGNLSLALPKEVWRMIASVASVAGGMGASASTAEHCRKLAARAEYYLGEPENKAGLVRGGLSRDEWTAYRKMVEELGDISPEVKALANTIAELSEGGDSSLIQYIDVREGKDQAQRDAAVVLHPDSLGCILAAIDTAVALSDPKMLTPEQMKELEDKTGVSAGQYIKESRECVASAKAKIAEMRDMILKSEDDVLVSLNLHAAESACVYSLLRAFLEAKTHMGGEPPGYEQAGEAHNRFLKCVVRFFARMSGSGDDVLAELQ